MNQKKSKFFGNCLLKEKIRSKIPENHLFLTKIST